ncbi:rab gtpase [Nannochloropsis gaditana]|uniref:Rab gtpase n=1 Tax=Nannochloropsis gaditana TaxID=72520 RepID=W7TKL6_9STRA|nr:rab gtpase [Nannochloropsis gaditana]
MARQENPFDMQIKLLMIGDSGVGKTCLLLRYANDSFSPTFITTIGIDFKIKNLELDGRRIKLQIWDTAGQERFRTITTSYFRGAQGILLVYDVTDRRSFESIRNWVGQIQQHADVHVNKILIGNKCDMTPQRVVSTEEGQSLANDFGIQFFETSAKNDINVEKSFVTIAREVKNRMLVDGGPRATGGKAIVDAKRSNEAKKCWSRGWNEGVGRHVRCGGRGSNRLSRAKRVTKRYVRYSEGACLPCLCLGAGRKATDEGFYHPKRNLTIPKGIHKGHCCIGGRSLFRGLLMASAL